MVIEKYCGLDSLSVIIEQGTYLIGKRKRKHDMITVDEFLRSQFEYRERLVDYMGVSMVHALIDNRLL